MELGTLVAIVAPSIRGRVTVVRALYSRRQMTWLRRDARIRWTDPTADDPCAALRDAAAAA